jgi:hypothetical protein
MVLVLLGGTLFALDGKKAELQNVDTVAEENCLSACVS